MSYTINSWTDNGQTDGALISATITLPNTVEETIWGVFVMSAVWIAGSAAANPSTGTVPVAPVPTLQTLVVDMDNPSNTASQDQTANPSLVVYGGSQASTSDTLQLNVLGAAAGTSYTWTVSGPGSAAYNPPPSNQASWTVAVQPNAGVYTFSVALQVQGASSQTLTRQVEVGIRTDDVIVVGWIDGNAVPYPNLSAVNSAFTSALPPNGQVTGTTVALCNGLVGALSEDVTSIGPPVLPVPVSIFSAATPGDTQYILDWLFQWASNPDPKAVLPQDFLNAAGTATDESKVSQFLQVQPSGGTNYKLFNRFQVRMRLTTDSQGNQVFNGTPIVLKQFQPASGVGTTVNPCGALPGIAAGAYPGQAGPLNGAQSTTSSLMEMINEGSPDPAPVRAFDTLMGGTLTDPPLSGASPVFWENIGSVITVLASGGTSPRVQVQPYPTYYVYVNGKFDRSAPQAADPSSVFVSNPYPFGTVSCSTFVGFVTGSGTVPGGRCGDGSSPADSSARTPPFLRN
jgi:hypothetical protein